MIIQTSGTHHVWEFQYLANESGAKKWKCIRCGRETIDHIIPESAPRIWESPSMKEMPNGSCDDYLLRHIHVS